MKIVVISESIDIEDSSASKANVAFINNLKDCGYDVTVYHYTKKEVLLPGIECHAIKEKRRSGLFFLSRFQTQLNKRLKINLHVVLENTFGFSFTFFNDIRSIRRVLPEIEKRNPDWVLTLSKGMSFRPHYALLSFTSLHKKWLANIHDPFPFHFNPRPYNWVQPGYRQKETFFDELSKKAAHGIFPSLLLKEWMGSYFPDFLKTGIVIPHQVFKKDVVKDVALPGYFNAEKFTLLHAGNLMKQRSPEGLIEGYKRFLQNNPTAENDSNLLLLGPAEYHQVMLEKYKIEEPQIIIVNEYVKFEVIYKLQQQVSVNVILESKAEISPFLPGKFPHCIEANRMLLLLSPYYSETRRLLGSDYEFWSEVDDVEAIAFQIEKLYKMWQVNPKNLELNRHDLLDYCSTNYLKAVIESLQQKK